MKALYQRRRDLFVDAMTKTGWTIKRPSATFYIWAHTPKDLVLQKPPPNSGRSGRGLHAGRRIRASGEGYVRFALSVDEKRMMEAVERIKKVKWQK